MSRYALPLASALALLLATPLAAQRIAAGSVPAQVLHGLQARYSASGTVDWARGADRDFVATFVRSGQRMRGVFTAAGAWVETATEIGAITLPAAVRTAVLANYRGYQFTDVWRVERATAPTLLFEIRLDRPSDAVTVRYRADGRAFSTDVKTAPPPPPAPRIVIAGEWRGTSACVNTSPDCHADSVVYRFTPVAVDSVGFDVQAFTIMGDREMPVSSLPCTLDRANAALYCSTGPTSWRFAVRHDSLIGGPTGTDHALLRRVAVRRVP